VYDVRDTSLENITILLPSITKNVSNQKVFSEIYTS
jgi:hypothetical protein